MKCDGLSADHLRQRAVPPSTLSLLGLVRHMAEVERSWFRRRLAGEDAPPFYYSDADRDGDFDNIEDADPEEAFATWRVECDHARMLVAATPPLDTLAVKGWQSGESISLRWILVHMIE